MAQSIVLHEIRKTAIEGKFARTGSITYSYLKAAARKVMSAIARFAIADRRFCCTPNRELLWNARGTLVVYDTALLVPAEIQQVYCLR